MPFFSKKLKSLTKRTVYFPRLPTKFRVIAVGIPDGLQTVLEPLLRQHNADVRYIADAFALLREPRMADVLLVCPIEMGVNRELSKRLKNVRIQLRYESEGNNDALHVLQLAIQVSTNPGSYAELKNRVDRFDTKVDKLATNMGLNDPQPQQPDPTEVLNSDIAGAMKLAAEMKAKEHENSEASRQVITKSAIAAAAEVSHGTWSTPSTLLPQSQPQQGAGTLV